IGHAENHVTLIENNHPDPNGSQDVLALKVTHVATPSVGNNFITFFGSGNDSLGSIQGNGAGESSMAGPAKDFAERLTGVDPSERLEPGDIVGVLNGRITRRTEGAAQALVVSTAPIIAGNRPGDRNLDGLALVALVGQAPVRVRGPV